MAPLKSKSSKKSSGYRGSYMKGAIETPSIGERLKSFWAKIRLDLLMIFVTILGSFIYTIGIAWFLDSNGLYSGGLVGLAQLIVNLGNSRGIDIPLEIGMLNLIFNIPLLYLGYKTLSKRFTAYSTLSIIVQTIILLSPLSSPDMIDGFKESFIGVVDGEVVSPGAVLTSGILGGLFLGVGTGIAMKFGSSTAGLDIYAQYYSFKKDKSVGGFFLIFNGIIIALAFVLLNPILAIFTLVRQIIATIALDSVHTSYNYLHLEVISQRSNGIAQAILTISERAVTLIPIRGGYSGVSGHKVSIVCSSYEMNDMIDVITKIDQNAFITSTSISRLEGRFKKKLIGQKK